MTIYVYMLICRNRFLDPSTHSHHPCHQIHRPPASSHATRPPAQPRPATCPSPASHQPRRSGPDQPAKPAQPPSQAQPASPAISPASRQAHQPPCPELLVRRNWQKRVCPDVNPDQVKNVGNNLQTTVARLVWFHSQHDKKHDSLDAHP